MTTLEQKQQAAAELVRWKHAEFFIRGAEWAEAQQRWIPVTERLPERGAKVLFIVDRPNSHWHGHVFGGKYTGDPASECFSNEFGTPGYCTTASHWQPSPEPPAQEDGQDGNNPDHSR